ncbi:MAG: hypothetical protein V1858_02955 [Candidatus Gottesmanbacteria bacterium]
MVEGDRDVLSKIKTRVKHIGQAFLPDKEEFIPLSDINADTVCKTIRKCLGTPIQKRFIGNAWANPFSVVDVLVHMGYLDPWVESDYLEKFPEEYRATRKALNDLVANKILKPVQLEDKDSHREDLYYQVVNSQDLQNN